MKSHNAVQKSGCLESTLGVIGDKWTALILRDLNDGPQTFSDLESSLAAISPRTLSQRLEKLISQEIVAKSIYCEHPPRYRYRLTKKGVELNEVIVKMAQWGEKYHPA